MNTKRVSGLLLVFLTLLAFSVSNVPAQDKEAKLDAQQIMNDVITPKDSCTVVVAHGIKATTYTHVTSDGLTFTRFETESLTNISLGPLTNGVKIKELKIINREGTWNVRPDMAIRMDYLNDPMPNQEKPSLNPGSTFTVEEKTNQEQPIYVVTETYSQQSVTEFLKAIAPSMEGKNPNYLAKIIPTKMVYSIGKSDHLIHGVKSLNSQGTVLFDVLYSSINTNPVAEALFEVPPDLKRVVVTKTDHEGNVIMPYLPPEIKNLPKQPRKERPERIIILTLLTLTCLGPIGFVLYFRYFRIRRQPMA
jgi:hypothetical protein